MNMTMKSSLLALLAASVAATANPVNTNQDLIESKADSALAKRGFEIGGSIRAVAERATFDNDDDIAGNNQMPEVERNEFVTADIDFRFRPYDNVRANVMMRLGGGMQEYFASAAKTLTVAWINVEGNVGNSFYWIVGDFRQQYSPLTLYTPGIDIMYEPMVFARQRRMAQKEQLIEGNQRNLQGINLQFRKEFNPVIGEFRAEGIFARVNRPTILDFTGAEGSILPNGRIPGATQASNTDKWLAAGNIELLPLNKNVYIGATPMYIFDNENTSGYAYRHEYDPDAGYIVKSDYQREKINPFDTTLQNTMVVSGRAGADVAGIMKNKNLVADVVGEFAMSMDKTDEVAGMNITTGPIMTEKTENGMAILATMNVGYKVENSFGANLAVDFVRNDEKWFNNLAQSSSFFAQRIMNSDKDGNQVRFGVNSPLYSTFDALYHFSPKFSPVATTLGTNDDATADGQTESYNIAPYNKNSWTTNVYTRAQLALLQHQFEDPALQLVLPNGLATANRMGGRAILTGNFRDFAEVQGLFSMFNEVKPMEGFKEASFMEYGGGAKVDIFKALGFTKPLEISGSYKHSERKTDYDMPGVDGSAELKSDFINAGLYVQYLPRLGVTGGFQMITTEINDFEANLEQTVAFGDLVKTPIMKGTQMQWMVGLDYFMEEHAWLAINFGIVNVKNEYNTALGGQAGTYTEKVVERENGGASYTSRTYKAGNSMNLPDYYYTAAGVPVASFTHEFSQTILQASINVEF